MSKAQTWVVELGNHTFSLASFTLEKKVLSIFQLTQILTQHGRRFGLGYWRLISIGLFFLFFFFGELLG